MSEPAATSSASAPVVDDAIQDPQAAQDLGYQLPEMSLSLQRPIVVSVVFGMIAVAATSALGHPFMGLFVCAGLFLGLVNMWQVQRAVAKVTAEDHPSKMLMAFSSFKRLGVISLVALVIGFFDRPDGLGVFLGLAVFQVVFLVNTSVPVLKGLRQQS